MPNKIAVTHPKTGRTIEVPPEQLPGLKAAGWGDEPTEPATDHPEGQESGQGGDQEAVVPDKASDVVAWIGTDPERAARALDVETQRSTPRPTVLDHIHTLTTPESQED